MSMHDLEKTLGEAVLADLDLRARVAGRAASPCDIAALARSASTILPEIPLVYTAFDGDHQHLVALMRHAVVCDRKVPVNPDSVLDYRETLQSRQRKRDVLLDDLSILRGCDELWVFTDVGDDASVLGDLAEGVLIELLFFLKRKPEAPVYFIALDTLVRKGEIRKSRWPLNFDATKEALAYDQREEIVSIANGAGKIDKELPHVRYYILDIADFKYARFLLPSAYSQPTRGNRRTAPLVPYLALSLSDAKPGVRWKGFVALGWAKLITLATEVEVVAPANPRSSPSLIARWLQACWDLQSDQLNVAGYRSLGYTEWVDYGIPKLRSPSDWAITDRERRPFR